MTTIIGFTGRAGSGKTTAARIIRSTAVSKYDILSFATPLKECIGNLFEFTPTQLYTYEGKEAVDERYGVSPRVVMQRFGTEFVRTTVPHLWTTLMRRRIEISTEFNLTALLDDCRFEDEVALVRELGGQVVHITGRGGSDTSHKSEKGVDIWLRDIVIDNSEDIQRFKRKLLTTLGGLL